MMNFVERAKDSPVCRASVMRLECKCRALNRLKPIRWIRGNTGNLRHCDGGHFHVSILVGAVVRHVLAAQFPRQQHRPEKHRQHRGIVLRTLQPQRGRKRHRDDKADAHLKSIPVVVLSSSRETPDLVECYQHGVNAYVVKPVDFGEFVEAVKQLGIFWATINEPPPEIGNQ